jgi:predicted Zn-dependent protease
VPTASLSESRQWRYTPSSHTLRLSIVYRSLDIQIARDYSTVEGDAGLIVRLVPPKAGTTHDEVIRNVLKPVDGRTEKRSIHGLAATHFTGTARNEQGQTRPVTLTLVTGPGERTYWLQYAAKDTAARQRAEAGLTEAESSFRAMTAADRAAGKPWSVQTVPYPRGGFGELARSSPLPAARAEAQLRLMNGVYGGGGEPKAGQPVKVVN